jgi:hypothetical protein
MMNIPLTISYVEAKLPRPVTQLITNYCQKCFVANPWIHFDGEMPHDIAIEVFLYWIVVYDADDKMGKVLL